MVVFISIIYSELRSSHFSPLHRRRRRNHWRINAWYCLPDVQWEKEKEAKKRWRERERGARKERKQDLRFLCAIIHSDENVSSSPITSSMMNSNVIIKVEEKGKSLEWDQARSFFSSSFQARREKEKRTKEDFHLFSIQLSNESYSGRLNKKTNSGYAFISMCMTSITMIKISKGTSRILLLIVALLIDYIKSLSVLLKNAANRKVRREEDGRR